MATMTGARIGSEALMSCLESRLFAYELLRMVYRQEPESWFARALAQRDLIQYFPYRDDSSEIQRGVRLVRNYLADPRNATEEAYERLHWDYHRLFVGPCKLPAPPWESAYRIRERQPLPTETLAVRRRYLSYGVTSTGSAEPEDHIGMELDFMCQTTHAALRHAERGERAPLMAVLRDQLDFLEQHLLTWVPQFTMDVMRCAQTDFYKGMAQVLNGFLAYDRTMVLDLLRKQA